MSKKVSGKTHTQKQLNDYANQHNPNNKAYKARQDNRANQINAERRKQEQQYDQAMDLLRELGVPFSLAGEPLGIGWED